MAGERAKTYQVSHWVTNLSLEPCISESSVLSLEPKGINVPLLEPSTSPAVRNRVWTLIELIVFLPLGGPLCSCCVPDPMGLSFLPTYGCQSNRTASVAALRMKAREHSEAVLQSANLLPSTSSSPSPASKHVPPEGSQDKTSPTKEQSEGEKSV